MQDILLGALLGLGRVATTAALHTARVANDAGNDHDEEHRTDHQPHPTRDQTRGAIAAVGRLATGRAADPDGAEHHAEDPQHDTAQDRPAQREADDA